MKLHGPIAFVEIYGSNGAMSIRRRVRLTFGDPLRLGAPPPNHVSSPSAPSSSKRKLFAIFGPYGPSCFVAHTPNLLDVPASGRKETHASSIRRTFAQQLPRRCASRLLASQVRRRRWKRGTSQLDPSEPNSQKANERKARKAKESNARPQSVPTGGGRLNFSITRSCNRLWSKSSTRSGFGPSKNAPR